MGDWCESFQSRKDLASQRSSLLDLLKRLALNRKTKITGAIVKATINVLRMRNVVKKKLLISKGEVSFYLTTLLMGDPT